MYYLNAPLVRVKRRSPCPICGKPDWCSVSEDGAMAICMRVAEGSIKESRDGGYVHILQEREYRPTNLVQRKPEPPPVAPIERRDAVYGALLAALPLAKRHADDLARRGLSSLTIARNAYASLPASPLLCGKLATKHNLANVPGFFRDDEGCWTLAANAPGFLIPVRDTQGRIQGCQIRQDFGARYVWLSSPECDGGASSGAPTHFARPWRVDTTGEAIITEGPLKTDITAELLDACVVGVPGVSSFGAHFGIWLKTRLPKLTMAFVAYDADWRVKPHVETALSRLFASLAGVGLNVVALDWKTAKGIDDLLVREVRG